MIRFLKRITENADNKQVLGNIFSLSGLQLANTFLPLVTIPYVVRVIGPWNYGVIAFAQAFVAYFVLVVNYGFDLSASREIARRREDKPSTTEIFWSVMWTKVILLIFSTVLFVVIVLTVSRVRTNWEVMGVTFFILLGYVAFPTWLFQGVEKLGLTAVFNFILKLIFTAGIFVFVRNRGDYLWVPLLASLGQIVAGAMAFIYAKVKLVDGVKLPNMKRIRSELKLGWTIFLSTVFISFYTSSNIVILAFFASQASVGYFAAATKIVIAFQALLLYPVAQATYPHVGKLMSEDRNKGGEYLKKITFFVVLLTLPASIGVYVFAPEIVKIVLGSQFLPSISVLRVVAPFPLIIGLSNVFGIQGVLNLNQDKKFFAVIAVGALLNIILNMLLAQKFREVGTAFAWLITETYITIAFLFIIEKNGIGVSDVSFYKRWLTRELTNNEN